MTITIQKVASREFLGTDPGDWVRDPHEALCFPNTRAALAFCRKHRLENVRLVVFFRKGRLSLLLYVPGSDTPLPTGETKAAVV